MDSIEGSPSVLLASACQLDATSIVEKLVGCVPCCVSQHEDLEVFPWHISSKYYDVDVFLITMKKKILIPLSWAGDVQGIVLLFDSYDERAIDHINSWYDAYLGHYDASIKILVCNRLDDDDPTCIKKHEAHRWCLRRGFELVELDPILDEEWESEQDFLESTGMLRVKQALTAHYWPNLILKEPSLPRSMEELWHGGLTPSSNSSGHLEEISKPETGAESVSFEGFTLKDVLSMRDQALKLPRSEKLRFAEQVAYALWNSIPENSN